MQKKIYDIKPRGRPPEAPQGAEHPDLPGKRDISDLHWFERKIEQPLPQKAEVTQPLAPVPEVISPVVSESVPKPPRERSKFFGRLGKRTLSYVAVGVFSYLFFSLLFYGFNVYQKRQRASLDNGQVAGEQNQAVSLRIVNASNDPARSQTVRSTLEQQGYTIRTTATSNEVSDKTIIYFKQSSSEKALHLAEVLSEYDPVLQSNENVTGLDELVVLIGK